MSVDEGESFNLEAALLSGGDDDDKSSPIATAEVVDKASLRSSLARGPAEPVEDEPEPDEPESDEVEIVDEPAAEADDEDDDGKAKPVETKAELIERMKSLGVDLSGKYANDDEALKGLANAVRLVGQKNDLAEYGKRLLDDPRGVYEYLKSQLDVEPPADDKKTKAAGPADAPEYDEQWADAFDAEGKLLPGADPTIPAKIAKYQKWVGDRARKFAADPEGALLPLFEKKIKELARREAEEATNKTREEIQREQAKQAVFSEAVAIVNEEADWAYVEGDARKGITPAGQVFQQFLAMAESIDPSTRLPMIPNMRMAKEWAKMMTQTQIGKLAAKDNGDERRKKQDKLGRKPNRKAADSDAGGWVKGQTLEEALSRSLSGNS
jgi:hypothetical protein